MAKLKLALCMEDREYQNRFTNCVMNHYQGQFEIHVFTSFEEFMSQENISYNGILLSGWESIWEKENYENGTAVIYLYDSQDLEQSQSNREGVIYVDKYQEVNKIMEEVLSHIGDEIHQVKDRGNIPVKTKFIGLYSPSSKEYQLPLAVTLGAILSEREKVLFVDLQENSGLLQLVQKDEVDQGLEELLVMAESGKYSRNRIMACIGKLDHMDFVYPARNTERLCETVAGTYIKLLQIIAQELDYSVCIINLGVRFVGFFELMNRCRQVLIPGRGNGISQWQEYEFLEEMKQRGYELLAERVQRLQLPMVDFQTVSCERMVEQWKWNDLGEYLRKVIIQEGTIG